MSQKLTDDKGNAMNYVTREFDYVENRWVSTFFCTMREAKTLCVKILKQGGIAICLNIR